jgi:hypothetical protein
MYFIKIPRKAYKRIELLSQLGEENKKFNMQVSRDLALEARRRIRKHIKKQDLDWASVKPEYQEQKTKEGYGNLIWKRTGYLYKKIKIIRKNGVNGFLGYDVGFEEDDIYPNTNIPVGLVAKVLEYGSPSRNIPARPLFRVVREEIRKDIKQYVQTKNNEFIITILRKFRR